jgi:hypothetical protein
MRGRDAYLAWNDPRLADVPDSSTLRSPAFADGASIPIAFAGVGVGVGVGDNVSPAAALERTAHRNA